MQEGEEVTPHSSMERLPPPPAAFLPPGEAGEEGEAGEDAAFREVVDRANLIRSLNARLSEPVVRAGGEKRRDGVGEGRGEGGGEGRRRAASYQGRGGGGGRGAPSPPPYMSAPSPPQRAQQYKGWAEPVYTNTAAAGVM